MNTKPLKDMRIDHDLSQKDIAEILSISSQYYGRYELGQVEMPIHHYIVLAKYYGVSLDYLCGVSPTYKPIPYDAEVTSEERKLLAAYSTAPENIRAAIRALLGVDTGSGSSKVIMNNININN